MPTRAGAITLIEVVVVCAIVIGLAALLSPVLLESRQAAQRAACMSNLSQLYRAVESYRTRYNGEGVLGTPAAMGLPTLRALTVDFPQVRCSGRDPNSCGPHAGYLIMWSPSELGAPETDETDKEWSEYVAIRQDSALLIYDSNHQFSCPSSPFSLNRIMAVTLGGSLKARVKRATMGSPDAFIYK